MKTKHVLLLLLLWPFVSFGQDKAKESRLCYSFGQLPSTTEKALRLAQEKGSQQGEFTTFNSCSYTIRVYFHIVRRTNGTGGQNVGVINTVMNNLNAAFSAQNISFMNIGNGEVKNDNLYDFADSDFNSLINGSYKRSDAINVYLLDDAATYDGGRAVIGGNSLVVGGDFQATDPDQLLVPSLVVAHEMGHCLGLYHTFETTFGAERVDGSNCTAAGDLVCDTPAESPAFAFQENNSCAYTLNLQDANGDTYNPDARNIMNYVRPSCYLGLTNGQGTRMRNTIGLGTGFADAVETTPVYTYSAPPFRTSS